MEGDKYVLEKKKREAWKRYGNSHMKWKGTLPSFQRSLPLKSNPVPVNFISFLSPLMEKAVLVLSSSRQSIFPPVDSFLCNIIFSLLWKQLRSPPPDSERKKVFFFFSLPSLSLRRGDVINLLPNRHARNPLKESRDIIDWPSFRSGNS